AAVSTTVMPSSTAIATVSSRLTCSSPPSGRRIARTTCGTRTALRMPPASSIEMMFGSLLATDQESAMLPPASPSATTPTTATSSALRSSPSTRETRVPLAITAAELASVRRGADGVAAASPVGALCSSRAVMPCCPLPAWAARGRRPPVPDVCSGRSSPSFCGSPAPAATNRADQTDDEGHDEQPGDHAGADVLPLGADVDDEARGRCQVGAAGAWQHAHVDGDVAVGD